MAGKKRQTKKTGKRKPGIAKSGIKSINYILRKDFLFKRVFSAIKEKPKCFFLMIVFDVLFVIALLLFIKLLNVAVPQSPAQIKSLFFGSSTLIFVFVVIYYLLLLLIYSFFKYCMLHYIESFEKKTKFIIKFLKQFFLLNLFNLVLFLVCAMIINFLIVAVKDTYQTSFAFWTITIFLFLFYIFFNLSHSIFIEEKNTINVIRLTFRTMFGRIKSYAGFLIHTIGMIIIFFILLLIVWLIFSIGLQMQLVYAVLFNVLSAILLYAIILTNRIYFFLAIKKLMKK